MVRGEGAVAAAEGDPDRPSLSWARRSSSTGRGFFPEVRPIAAMKARIWIAQGKLSEAAAWARNRVCPSRTTSATCSEFDHLTLVRLLIAQHREHPATAARPARPLACLARLLEAAETGWTRRKPDGDPHAAGSRPGRAGTPDTGPARRLTRPSPRRPEPDGYARLFLAKGRPMTDLLQEPRSHGTAGTPRPPPAQPRRTAETRAPVPARRRRRPAKR